MDPLTSPLRHGYRTQGYPVDDALRRAHRAQRDAKPRYPRLRAAKSRLMRKEHS
jgi:hypothetical protein